MKETAIEQKHRQRAMMRLAMKEIGFMGWWVRTTFSFISPFRLVMVVKYPDRLKVFFGSCHNGFTLWRLYGDRMDGALLEGPGEKAPR